MTYDQCLRDRQTREAITLNFVVIGEAVKKIPMEVIDRYPHVPWKEFAGIRDKMVHGDFQISPTIMWETIQHDLEKPASVVKMLLCEETRTL